MRHGTPAALRAVHVSAPGFRYAPVCAVRLVRPLGRGIAGGAPQPPHLREGRRDDARTLARHLDVLAAMLLAPDAHLRRLARSLRRGDVFVLSVAPRRAPRRDRRDHLEGIAAALDQAREERRARRWLRDDSS